MQRLFSPAITVLNRMGYTKKFTLLWVMSLLAIAVVVYSLFVNLDRVIQPSQQRLKGLALIEPITRTVQSIQLHRGLSATLLGGNQSMRDKFAASEMKAVEAFKTVEGKLPASLAASEDFRHINADWERLRKDGLKWTIAENFAAHTRLIEQIQWFELLMADEYLLAMDQDLATYYLIDIATNKLSRLLENLGQLRAYGTGVLIGRSISEDQRIELRIMLAELNTTLNHLNIIIGKVSHYNPAMQGALRIVSEQVAGSVQTVGGIVKSDILTGRLATPPETFLNMATAEIDSSYAQMYETLLPMAESLTSARIDRARKELFTSVGISLLIFMLVVYLSVSIYYAIIGSIQSLARSARAFAAGNLQERVKLETHDELSWVSDSFNEMADGFNALLEAQKQAENALRKSKKLLQKCTSPHILEGSRFALSGLQHSVCERCRVLQPGRTDR